MENFKSINVMAHFAEIDENNIVLRVVVIDDEHEHRGHEFLSQDLGLGGTWLKTSYNTFRGEHLNNGTPLRNNYAGIGDRYDPQLDAFIPKCPFPSWVDVDPITAMHIPPKPQPPREDTDPFVWDWNEELLDWVKIDTTLPPQ